MLYKDFKASDFAAIPQGSKINARVLELSNRNEIKVFVFCEKIGVYSCLLPIENTKATLPKLNGLSIQYEQFKMPESDMIWYILIECNVEEYLGNFVEILKEIINELDNSKNDTAKCVNLIISKWRHFLSTPISQIMSEEEIIGLAGELLFLCKSLDELGLESLDYWVASEGEEDFIVNNSVFEIKSTVKEKHEHIINGIDQLIVIPERKKYILSLIFSKSMNDKGIDINSMINDCLEKLKNSYELVDKFFLKLRKRGFDQRDSNLYSKYKFNFIKGNYFHIDNSFPKLTSQELIKPLNSRITKVRYTLDMEGIESLDFKLTKIQNLLI